jgi:alpha-tubulin suppressor-like RCC1 family protein
LNADGKNISIREPTLNLFFKELREMDPQNEIIKIDSADESCGALTKGGKLYSWGKNDKGQLGTGAGVGYEYTEAEKRPLTVHNNHSMFITDFHLGDNTMMFKDTHGRLYRTGLKVDYTPSLIEVSEKIQTKSFFSGNSFYSLMSGILVFHKLK